jgi:hypothetical protein
VTWIVICKNSKYVFKSVENMAFSLNPNKCAFIVFSGMILGFIVSKERKQPNPKKIQAIVNMPPL